MDGSIAERGFFGDSPLGAKSEDKNASGGRRAVSASDARDWKRYGDLPFLPRTVAVPSDENPSARAAWLRSEVDSMWSQSSSSSPRLVPLACPELLLGSPVAFELKSSTDTSVVFHCCSVALAVDASTLGATALPISLFRGVVRVRGKRISVEGGEGAGHRVV